MKILITNDDGIRAEGLAVLAARGPTASVLSPSLSGEECLRPRHDHARSIAGEGTKLWPDCERL